MLFSPLSREICSTPENELGLIPRGRAKYERLAEKDRARYDVAKREYAMQKKEQNVRFCQTETILLLIVSALQFSYFLPINRSESIRLAKYSPRRG